MNHPMKIIPIDRVIDKFLGEFDVLQRELFSNPFFHDQLSLSKSISRLPKINVKEEKDKFIVEAAIPGLKKEDVELIIEDNDLIIKHNKKGITEADSKEFLLREVSYRSFERRIPFHEKIKESEIKARLIDGILKIEIPKEASEVKKIGKIEIE